MTLESQLADELPEVLADENQLRQALINLVRNAADAMNGKGGAVRITTRKSELGVEIHVADEGPGIPEDVREKIWEPFFSTKEGGTGLGLALTRQIISEHGGSVEVTSGPRGTQITVELPAAPAA
jgi:signal transduction histidine kinase